MGGMGAWSIAEENWRILLELFPKGWEEQATTSGAVARLRGFSCKEDLMRTLLLHVARGYSLRETVVRAKGAGLAQVSDVALLKRLRKSQNWLRALCLSLLQENGIAVAQAKRRLRIVDATMVREPGKTGSLWRIHYSLQLPSLVCDHFELTPNQGKGGGESLRRFPVAAGDFIVGDRGYSSPPGIEYLAEAGAYVLVRLNTGTLRLFTQAGELFPLSTHLRSLKKPGKVAEWEVVIKGRKGPISGRLCAIRKSKHSIQKAHKKIQYRARKEGIHVKKETFQYAKHVLVFTTFPKTEFKAAEILECYRLRWQIELVFKRLKSLVQVGHVPKYDAESSRAWLYGKLLVALLAQKLVRIGREFSPWGYLLDASQDAQSLA